MTLLGPNTLLNTLFSNTLSLRFSLNVSNQVSHPYKTTGKIIVLYILIFTFLLCLDFEIISYFYASRATVYAHRFTFLHVISSVHLNPISFDHPLNIWREVGLQIIRIFLMQMSPGSYLFHSLIKSLSIHLVVKPCCPLCN